MISLSSKNYIRAEKSSSKAWAAPTAPSSSSPCIPHASWTSMAPSCLWAKWKAKPPNPFKPMVPFSFLLMSAEISKVPYGEANTWMKGFHSAYYNQSHIDFRKAIRKFYAEHVNILI